MKSEPMRYRILDIHLHIWYIGVIHSIQSNQSSQSIKTADQTSASPYSFAVFLFLFSSGPCATYINSGERHPLGDGRYLDFQLGNLFPQLLYLLHSLASFLHNMRPESHFWMSWKLSSVSRSALMWASKSCFSRLRISHWAFTAWIL